MRWLVSVGSAAVLLALSATARADVLARWTQYEAGGGASVRAVVTDPACPEARVDGVALAMSERAGPAGGFPERVCVLAVTAGAAAIEVAGVPVPAPAKRLDRIVVVGDTGCRIKGNWAQDCNDPTHWAWSTIAEAAAATKPDLVIHVGDYLYRERPCPTQIQPGCVGSPSGDNWATWSADFFTPATPLLAAAPWIVVRGNHEICSRAGIGWSRMLSADPYDTAMPCPQKDAPYEVTIGDMRFAVIDTSFPPDNLVDPAMVAILRGELAWVADTAKQSPTWLITHKPAWSISPGPHQRLYRTSDTFAAAAGEGFPTDLELVLSGHVHLFEALTFTNGGPGQLVVGNSGTMMDRPAPADLSGLAVGVRTIREGLSIHEFGFFLFERAADGWNGRMIDDAGRTVATCAVTTAALSCRLAG